MKNVLIISYDFPPNPAIGSLRIQGLAKYLPQFGWNPIVLTVNIFGTSDPRFRVIQTPYYNIEAEWKKRLGLKPNETVKQQLHISNAKNKKSLLDYILSFALEIIAYPDSMHGWYKYALKAGDELFKKERIDAIISSSSPVTTHLIAADLKMRYNISWIADLRDLWTQNHYYPYSPIRRYIDRRLELNVLSNADALVTVSDTLANSLAMLHNKKVNVIQNGFDSDDFSTNLENLTEKFTITYTGRLYNGKRDPSKLFQAVSELITDKKIISNDIEVRFFGKKENWLQKEIEKYDLTNVVTEYGNISRFSAIQKQRESQVLLLLLWDHPEEIGVYTGKVFEYLAAQRPILAIGGKEGIVKELLKNTSSGAYASSVGEIKLALENFYTEYKQRGYVSYSGKPSEINKYSQREMARKFAIVLDEVRSREQA